MAAGRKKAPGLSPRRSGNPAFPGPSRQKRAEAEVELRKLEGDLKQKLLSIRQ